MKRITTIALSIFSVIMLSAGVLAQTPVPMSSQPGLSYTENFADIANWTNGFAAGTGANRFGAVAANAAGTIPDGVRITTATTSFVTGSTGGVQRGSSQTPATTSIVLLSTGTTDNTTSAAIDFFMDFTGVNAGTLSFDWASVNNSTGNRSSSLRVYWSVDGTAYTEIPAAQILNFTNNVLTGGSLTAVSLPAAFNNNPNARLRFYYHNGTGGTTGSRPKISIDNLNVTANAIVVAPDLSINDVSQDETNAGTTNLTFTVSLSAPAPAGGVTFDIATADNTATIADNDYAANSLTGQTIPEGSSNYQFTVLVNGDTTVETNETFFVNITNVTGANVTDGQGQGTIVNDDVPAAAVGFSSSNYSEDESQTAFITVNRTGDLSGTTTVDYSTQNQPELGIGGAATGGASCTFGVDFIHQSGTLTFGIEEDFKEIQIQLCSDTIVENDEVFNVYLSNINGGAPGEITTAQVLINDTANEFVNTDQIFIGTGGDSYDSSIEVSGVPRNIGGLRVTLFDFNHLTADDIDVLLVGPQGQKFLLMADAGGGDGLAEGATITFEDAAGMVLPNDSQILSGRYEPTTWEAGQTSFPAPAPAAPYEEPGSTVGGPVTLGSVFGGTNANGTWTLYIRDDNNAFQRLGADGVVAGGWGIQFLAPTAANVSVSGQVRSGKTPIANAAVMITGGNLTEPLFTKTNSFGNYNFESLTVGGTYVVTVVSKRYNFPQSSIVLSLEDSVINADFEAEER